MMIASLLNHCNNPIAYIILNPRIRRLYVESVGYGSAKVEQTSSISRSNGTNSSNQNKFEMRKF